VPQQSTTPDNAAATPRYDRTAATVHLDGFRQQHRSDATSARQFAREHDLPPSTLRYWSRRQHGLAPDPVLAAFLDSPSGLTFVHRLCTAAHLVFCLQGPCGLRLLSAFLRRAGLDRVVAASLGACQARQVQLEHAVVTFAHKERQRLATAMAPREITVAADETYHPACCLVALDAAAGFLLVEKYAASRDQATWDAALAEGLTGLPAVTVRQVVGDCAKGLVAHAQQGLGVPHSPDLFHAQHELTKALAPAVAAHTREAQRCLARLQDQRAAAQEAAATATTQPRGPGRPPNHASRVQHAEQSVAGMERHVKVLTQRQEALRTAIRGLGEDDHPVQLTTGHGQEAEQVRVQLEQRLAAVEQLALAAGVSAKVEPALKKVRRQLPGLVAAVAFFWVRAEAAATACFGTGTWVWAKPLLCGQYLRRVAGQVPGAQRRRQLRTLADQILAAARGAAGAERLADWEAAERWGREVAGWFARSSSAVEGRNGQLALRYHSLHRLPTRKLQALTAVHNYWLTRGDGTTAAERFFGQPPSNLFDYLVEHLPVPARPAKRRPKAA
jgi:Family of unknown function (DUF6399)